MNLTQGRYSTISNEEYHRKLLSAYSKSDIDAVMLSPANLIQKRATILDTDAVRFGQAMHSRLEFFDSDQKYLDLVAVPPKADGRTVEGKALKAEFEKMSKGKLILDEKEWDLLERMLAGLKSNPEACGLLSANGVNEETFVWEDKDSGVFCKVRPDKRVITAPKGLPDNIVVDWKTIDSCDRRNIQKSIFERGYHIQAAMITDGLEQVLGYSIGPFVNVFIEKNRPNRVLCVVIPDSDIELGRRIYKENLTTIAACLKKGVWPGFVDIGLPSWAV